MAESNPDIGAWAYYRVIVPTRHPGERTRLSVGNQRTTVFKESEPMRIRRIIRSLLLAASLATITALGWATTIFAASGGSDWL
jgi:hypothetical protein